MADPKPIALTSVASNAYDGPAPQPFVAVGGVPGAFDAAEITGYDAGETQTLKSVSGVLTWVTDTPE